MNPLSIDSRLLLFEPPYERFTPIDTTWYPTGLPPRGLGLVWLLEDGNVQQPEFEWLFHRPFGLPLFIVLPPPQQIGQALPLLSYVNALQPRSVLPNGPVITPFNLNRLLKMPPKALSSALTSYLIQRQLLLTDKIRHYVKRIFASVPDVVSVSKLARKLYTSRRTLGRHFASAGLPVPSHWLQFGRLLTATLRLQNDQATVCRIAAQVGYPDGFTLSNQMKRLLGCRPTDIRRNHGWEWIVELWIREEVRTGGINRDRYRDAILMYLDDQRGDPRNSRARRE